MKKTGEEEEGKGRDGERGGREGGQESKGRKEAKGGGGGKKWVFLAHVANEEFSRAPGPSRGNILIRPTRKSTLLI